MSGGQFSGERQPGPPLTRHSPLATRHSKRWVWFFVIVGVMAAAGVAAEVWVNLSQQLTPEKLTAARQLWRDRGPRDYTLEYAVKREYNPDPAGRAPDRYTVRVKGGKVESVTDAGGRSLKPGEYEFGSMDALFDAIDEQLKADIAAGGKRPFLRADFDPADGHVTYYRRSVTTTRELLEVVVRLQPGE
jgi:hypothetical protein